MDSRKIFLAGANGYIGTNFRRMCSDLDVRPITRDGRHLEDGTASISIDALTSMSPDPGAALIHLAGCSREKTRDAIRDGNIVITERLLAACRHLGVNRVIYVSGFGIGRYSSTVYYSARAYAEQLILTSGLSAAVLRCSYILGGQDEMTPHLLRLAHAGEVTVPGSGAYRVQPVYIGDLVEALRRLATTHASIDGLHDFLGEAISYRELVSGLVERLRPDCRVRSSDLEDHIKEAVFATYPTYSLTQLAILLADYVGKPTQSFVDVTPTPIPDLIDLIIRDAIRLEQNR